MFELFELFIFRKLDQNGLHLRDHFGVILLDLKIHSCVMIFPIWETILVSDRSNSFTKNVPFPFPPDRCPGAVRGCTMYPFQIVPQKCLTPKYWFLPDSILWLPMSRAERSRCIRWRLGWLPGGKPKPCPHHPDFFLTKSHAWATTSRVIVLYPSDYKLIVLFSLFLFLPLSPIRNFLAHLCLIIWIDPSNLMYIHLVLLRIIK
jgi:hypothetical protein